MAGKLNTAQQHNLLMANESMKKQMSSQTKAPNLGNLSERRAVLELIRQNFKNQKPVISEDELRVNTVLGNNQLTVNVNQDANNPPVYENTMRLLNKNDLFVATHIGMFLMQQLSGSVSSASYPPYVNGGKYGFSMAKKLTYPDTTLQDAVTPTTVLIDSLAAMYESNSLNISINTRVLYKSFPLRDCLYVPITQKYSVTAVIGDTSVSPPTGVTTYNPFDNQRNGESGYIKLGNMLLLSGAGQNDITSNILPMANAAAANAAYQFQVAAGSAATLGGTGAIYQNAAAFHFKGYIVKNVTYTVDDVDAFYARQGVVQTS